ncbi:MAG: YndJ family protein, partial [Halobacteriales archaeon]|nr:YndJ family protein [Halobacteriales archaeon]
MHPARRLRIQAALGGVAFLALAVFAPWGWDADGVVVRALALAILVVVPLGFALAAVPDRRGREPWPLRAAAWLHAPAASLAVVALLMPPGPLAGALCIPWLAFATLGVLWAAIRLLSRPWPLAQEFAFDASLAFLLNGALFLLFWRAGLHPLGFPSLVIALTAIHFHFASFAIPAMLGMAGRVLRAGTRRGRSLPLAVAACAVGLPLTAAGIIASPLLEAIGAALVALAGLAAALLTTRAAHRVAAPAAPVLGLAAAAALGGMLLAAAYGTRSLLGAWVPPMETMLFVHSALNGAGFATLGLAGWTFSGKGAVTSPPGIPFSQLRSHGSVGPTFFERTGAVDAGRSPPRGLAADLGAFASARFHPDKVHPAIRAFYEDTLACSLVVRPAWPRSSAGRRVWARLGRRFGQMDFPRDDAEGQLDSRLLALRSAADGRTDVRGWVRTRPDGRALYAAAYSTHAWNGETYANIAFPLPGGNLTSILRWQDLDGQPGG